MKEDLEINPKERAVAMAFLEIDPYFENKKTNVLIRIFSYIANISLVILFFASFGMILIFALLLTIRDSCKKNRGINKN